MIDLRIIIQFSFLYVVGKVIGFFCSCKVRTLSTDKRSYWLIDMLAPFVRGVISLRYRVRVRGIDAVKNRDDARPIIFLPNHPAMIDPLLVCAMLSYFKPRPLADESQINKPIVSWFAGLLNTVPIPDLRSAGRGARKGVLVALKRCVDALKGGDNLLFYPAGGVTRDGREHIGTNGGLFRLLEQAPDCRIVLVRTRGFWGSSFSCVFSENGKSPDMMKCLMRGALRLVCNLIFFMPRRDIDIYLEEKEGITPLSGDSLALNRCLEEWYEKEPETGYFVPYYFWQGSKPVNLRNLREKDDNL